MSEWLNKTFFVLPAFVFFMSSVSALEVDTKGDVENLRVRIEKLEGKKAEPEERFLIEALGKRMKLSGILELEVFFNDTKGAGSTSDIVLATARLGVELMATENISGLIVFLHEEDGEEPVEIDEAVITLSHPGSVMEGRVGFIGGKMYVPFGNFAGSFISDPLTLELGETNNTALVFDWLHDMADIKVGIFNGAVDTANGDDIIDSFVASLSLTPVAGVTIGTSFISDLAESDIGLVVDENLYKSSVPGVSVFTSLEYKAFTIDFEYLFATAKFDQALVGAGTVLTGRRPSALNLELGLIPAARWHAGARYEQANDFQDDLRRYGAVVSYGIFKNTVLALEYLLGDDGATSHTVTAQLAYQF